MFKFFMPNSWQIVQCKLLLLQISWTFAFRFFMPNQAHHQMWKPEPSDSASSCKSLGHSHVQAFAAANLLKKRTFTFRFFMPSSSSPACANRQTQQQFELLLLQMSSTFVFRFLHAKLIITKCVQTTKPSSNASKLLLLQISYKPAFLSSDMSRLPVSRASVEVLTPQKPNWGEKKTIDCSGNPCRSGARELDRSILREASKSCPTARLSSSFPISSSYQHPRNTAIATREASATRIEKERSLSGPEIGGAMRIIAATPRVSACTRENSTRDLLQCNQRRFTNFGHKDPWILRQHKWALGVKQLRETVHDEHGDGTK